MWLKWGIRWSLNIKNVLRFYSYFCLCLFSGNHTVAILYAGQPITGSPFYVSIYDPNKIRVEGMKGGLVDEHITFESKSLIGPSICRLDRQH